MNTSVDIVRCKRTGNFILNPYSTFRGYGGYVAINPYREVLSDAPSEILGQVILQLLQLAGPTAVDIAEVQTFLAETADEETVRLNEEYGIGRRGSTTSKMAKRFLSATVAQRHRQKSWVVQYFSYHSRLRCMSGSEHPPVRVRHSIGPSGLGDAVFRVLKL